MSADRRIRYCGLGLLSLTLLLGSAVTASALGEGEGVVTIHPARVELSYGYQGVEGECSNGREFCVERGKVRTRDMMELMCGEEDLPSSFAMAAMVSCDEQMDMLLVVYDREAGEPVECMPLPLENITTAYAETQGGKPKHVTTNSITDLFEAEVEMLLSISGRAELRPVPEAWEVDADVCVGRFKSTAVAGAIGIGEEGGAVIEKGKIRLGKPFDATVADLEEILGSFLER